MSRRVIDVVLVLLLLAVAAVFGWQMTERFRSTPPAPVVKEAAKVSSKPSTKDAEKDQKSSTTAKDAKGFCCVTQGEKCKGDMTKEECSSKHGTVFATDAQECNADCMKKPEPKADAGFCCVKKGEPCKEMTRSACQEKKAVFTPEKKECEISCK